MGLFGSFRKIFYSQPPSSQCISFYGNCVVMGIFWVDLETATSVKEKETFLYNGIEIDAL